MLSQDGILSVLFLVHVVRFKVPVCDGAVLPFIFFMTPVGGVCPAVDPDVLPVPCCPLLHHLVCPLPPLHWHHCRATANSHYHGNQLDDHRCAPSHLWGLNLVNVFVASKHTFLSLLFFFISWPAKQQCWKQLICNIWYIVFDLFICYYRK